MTKNNNVKIDSAADFRKGEELDKIVLNEYLHQNGVEIGSISEIKQFHGGYSNLTYLLATEKGDYVLRRPPFGANIKSAHDMKREFTILSKIKEAYPKVPEPVIHCSDESVIGAEFYIMERVKGVILKPILGDQALIEEDLSIQIANSIIDNLADIHQVDLKVTGLEEMGRPKGYIERQVTGWSKRYRNAQTDEVKAIETLLEWLPSNMPKKEEIGFIHNDYKIDNIVLHPDRLEEIVAVLDWEMATVGDTLMDLGSSLSYWIEPTDHKFTQQFNPYSALSKNLSRQEALERYLKKSGHSLDNFLFYYVFGCFKIAVILQQIYARYVKGHNKNPQVAGFIHLLTSFAENGAMALKYNRIGDFR